MNDSQSGNESRRSRFPIKLVLIIIALATAVLAFWHYGDLFTAEALAEREDQIVAFHEKHAVLVIMLAYLFYTAVTGASLPGAAVMTLLFGWFFQRVYGQAVGLAVAVLVVSFASTSGATLAFLLSRYLFRDAIQRKFGDRLAGFNRALEREGAFYLFTLRLIPAVPFFVINVVMGLTPIKTRTYWWVSQVGMLPGTCAYVYAGTTLPGPKDIVEKGAGGILNWQIIVAFAILGLFPLVVKKIMNAVRPPAPETRTAK